MKQLSIFILFFVMSVSLSYAAIITVDNTTPSVGNYKTLQEMHDAANDGDTIYVYPSSSPYQGIVIEKNLTILGTGYGSPGPELKSTVIAGTMTFNEGAEGAKLQGFNGSFNVTISTGDVTVMNNVINGMTINGNKIFVFRNNISNITVNGDNANIKQNIIKTVSISANHIGTVFLQNYIRYDLHNDYIVKISSNNEVLFINNIIWNNNNTYNSTYRGKLINASSTNITITLQNNVLWATNTSYVTINLENADSYMENNIIIYGKLSSNVKNHYYNISNSTQFPSDNGNIRNVNMNTVFVDHNNGNFHLKEDSPAIGAGKNGLDMGIYGGNTPFVDSSPDTSRPPVDINSGKPGLPSIIQFEAESGILPSDGLKIEIKAKSNQ